MKNKCIILILVCVFYSFYFEKDFCYGEAELGLLSVPQGVEVSWENKNLDELASFILIRKEENCLQNFSVGKEIYRGNGKIFFDKDVRNSKDYCYELFFVDAVGNVSEIIEKNQVKKEGRFLYYSKFLQSNMAIFAGIFLVAVLFLIERKFYKKKKKL